MHKPQIWSLVLISTSLEHFWVAFLRNTWVLCVLLRAKNEDFLLFFLLDLNRLPYTLIWAKLTPFINYSTPSLDTLKIVLFLVSNPNMRHKDILRNLDITSSTLSYHLNKLVDFGIIQVKPHGREKGYSLKNKEEIVKILKKYELQIELHFAIDGFKDLWEDFDYGSLIK